MLTAQRIPITHEDAGITASALQWDWPLQHNDGIVKVQDLPDRWEIDLDMAYFTPKEIEVKVVGDNLCFHCQHENRNDPHGAISREINRSYRLPESINRSTIKSRLLHNGVLRVTANKN